MDIYFKNQDLTNAETTYLSSAIAAGVVNHPVKNNQGFVANDLYILGGLGEEGTEQLKVGSVSADNTITSSTVTRFAHTKNTKIIKIQWNQYSLEVSTDAGVTYSVVVTTNLDWDTELTKYTYTAGTSAYKYRVRFYNSQTAAYSNYSDVVIGTGYTRVSAGYMLKKVRLLTNDPNGEMASDTEVLGFLNEAQDEVYSSYSNWYFLRRTDSTKTAVDGQYQYGLPSGWARVDSISFRLVVGTTADNLSLLTYLPYRDWQHRTSDMKRTDDDNVFYWTLLPIDTTYTSGSFGVYPTPATTSANNKFYVDYYKKMTDLDSWGDETDVPLPWILESYAASQIWKIRGDENRAEYYETKFRNGIGLLKREQKKQVGQPDFIVWRGQRGYNNFFGDGAVSIDPELYW